MRDVTPKTCLSLLFCALLTGPIGAAAQQLPAGSIRVQQVKIMDNNGFGAPMPAASMLIPVGWKAQGGVIWQQRNQPCGNNAPFVQWSATSPDGLYDMKILPDTSWSGHNMDSVPATNQCPNVRITTIKEYLLAFVKHSRPGATVLDFRTRPDIDKQFGQTRRTNRFMQAVTEYSLQTGQVLIGFERQGVAMREVIAVTAIFSHQRLPGVMPGEVQELFTLATLPGFAVRAPAGKLDFRLAEMFRKAGKPEPQWAAKMAEHRNKMNRINAKGAADRHNIRMKGMRDVAEINQRGWERRQKIRDKSNEQFSQMIRGVQPYREPGGTTVELPSSYSNAWRLPDNTYILTDDALFDPRVSMGVDAQKLEPAR